MGANLDLSFAIDSSWQNTIVLLAENFQNGLIARLEEVDAHYSAQFTTRINHTVDKMHEYSRRLQALNRNILEITKRVQLILSRTQILDKERTEAMEELLVIS
ncbi:hypothetical protein DINM_022139 [Dirofilaria immitis]|nr:hypothetical protein [Dirofilaria immitis]